MSAPGPHMRPLYPLLALSAIPLLAGAVRLLQLALAAPGVDARFAQAPWPVALHILASAVFCVGGAWQIDAAARTLYARLPRARHRRLGWLVLASGALAAATGLWMALTYAIPAALQGPLLRSVRVLVGTGMLLALALAVAAIAQGHVARHRAWMLRAYALGQGAGTQVLLLLPATLLAGEVTGLPRDLVMASAWLLNLLIVETCLQRPLQPA